MIKRFGLVFGRFPALAVFVVAILLYIVFTALNPRFSTVEGLTSVLTVASELGIMTVGEAFLMIAGEFDLSVSGVYALCGAMFAALSGSVPSILALGIVLLVAVIIGYINANVTTKLQVPSFIATLGMLMITRGALLAATGGHSIFYKGDAFVPTFLARQIGLGFRPSQMWFVLFVIIFSFVLTKTKYGNWVFATGGDLATARSYGVPVQRVKEVNFILSAVLAAFAGCIAVSRFKFGNVALGTQMELEAIASATIGGTLLTGGYGTIIGAGLGAVVMSMMRTGLVMAGAPGYWYKGLIGIILLVATALNLRIKRLWSG